MKSSLKTKLCSYLCFNCSNENSINSHFGYARSNWLIISVLCYQNSLALRMGKCDNQPLRANRYLGSWYFYFINNRWFCCRWGRRCWCCNNRFRGWHRYKLSIASIWGGNMLGYLFTELSVATSKQFSESEALRVKYEEGKISGWYFYPLKSAH